MKHIKTAITLAMLAGAIAPAFAEVSDEQVQALEARIAQLEADAANSPAPDAMAAKHPIKINGFMSAGFGQAAIEGFSYEGLGQDWSNRADSMIGLQFDARVNEKTHAVVQLNARGSDSAVHGNEDFGVGVEWAYISYRPTDQDEFRVGRVRLPFFMISEYLDVGYAYPWARPPAEVYQALSSLSAFEGVAWQHQLITRSEFELDAQLMWGSGRFPALGGTLTGSDMMSLGLRSELGSWSFSATWAKAMEMDLEHPLFDGLAMVGVIQEPSESGSFGGLGVQYDNGKWLLMAEATQIKVPGFSPDTENAYVTAGYRFGKVMPHLTWATTSVTDKDERPSAPQLPMMCPPADPNPNASVCLAIIPNMLSAPPPATLGVPFPADTLALMFNNEQDSITLGVRYDFLPNAALKVDWTRVIDTHNTFGAFVPAGGNFFYDFSAAPGTPAAKPGDDVDIFRIVVDVVF